MMLVCQLLCRWQTKKTIFDITLRLHRQCLLRFFPLVCGVCLNKFLFCSGKNRQFQSICSDFYLFFRPFIVLALIVSSDIKISGMITNADYLKNNMEMQLEWLFFATKIQLPIWDACLYSVHTDKNRFCNRDIGNYERNSKNSDRMQTPDHRKIANDNNGLAKA